LGEEDHLEKGYIDKCNWVRSPESNGWICESDLPTEKGNALYDRINREADTYENYLKRPKDTPELWKAKDELWRIVSNYKCFIEWRNDDRAAALHKLQELGEYLCQWQEQHPEQVDRRIGRGRRDKTIASTCGLVQAILDIVIRDQH